MVSDYPTDDDLQRISGWSLTDPLGWIEFVCEVWHWPDWGIRRTQRRLYMSTGGWNGNEEIVAAMQGSLLWRLGFVSHRRGGHYVFDLTRLREKWAANDRALCGMRHNIIKKRHLARLA